MHGHWSAGVRAELGMTPPECGFHVSEAWSRDREGERALEGPVRAEHGGQRERCVHSQGLAQT